MLNAENSLEALLIIYLDIVINASLFILALELQISLPIIP